MAIKHLVYTKFASGFQGVYRCLRVLNKSLHFNYGVLYISMYRKCRVLQLNTNETSIKNTEK